jgi:DNA-binding PucR family transcriptional regulator
VTPARTLAQTAARLAEHHGHGTRFLAGIGGAAELERASYSYIEALRATRIARAMPNLGPVVAWDDVGIFRPLSLLPEDEVDRSGVDPRVRQLLANATLAETAERFLDLAGNVQQTAAELHLHRTALYHRLDRIGTLYGLDLQRSGDDRLLAHLGLKLARLGSS